ncbi:MAG: hypothetical protein AAF533_21680 [Acidobacteriota bacterium]
MLASRRPSFSQHVPLVACIFAIGLEASPASSCCAEPPSYTAGTKIDVFSQATATPGESLDFHFHLALNGSPGTGPSMLLCSFNQQYDAWLVPLNVPASEGGCTDPGNRALAEPLSISENVPRILLDNSYHPAASRASSHTGSFSVAVPEREGDWAIVGRATFTNTEGGTPQFAETCVLLGDDDGGPTATLDLPVAAPEGGTTVPLAIRVQRNGHDPSRPLRLVVERSNPGDSGHLIPLEPAALLSEGVEILGDDVTVPIQARFDFTCFAGLRNHLNLKLLDGDEVVHESQVVNAPGAAALAVARAPLVGLEVLRVQRGQLTQGHDSVIDVRLSARNPRIGSPITGLRMDWRLPEGVEILTAETRHPDNPEDTVTATPARMATSADVQFLGDEVVLLLDRLEHRWVDGVTGSPQVFEDVVQLDLTLSVSASALTGSQLVLEGPEMTGLLYSRDQHEIADDVVLPVVQRGRSGLDSSGARRSDRSDRLDRTGARRGL